MISSIQLLSPLFLMCFIKSFKVDPLAAGMEANAPPVAVLSEVAFWMEPSGLVDFEESMLEVMVARFAFSGWPLASSVAAGAPATSWSPRWNICDSSPSRSTFERSCSMVSPILLFGLVTNLIEVWASSVW